MPYPYALHELGLGKQNSMNMAKQKFPLRRSMQTNSVLLFASGEGSPFFSLVPYVALCVHAVCLHTGTQTNSVLLFTSGEVSPVHYVALRVLSVVSQFQV